MQRNYRIRVFRVDKNGAKVRSVEEFTESFPTWADMVRTTNRLMNNKNKNIDFIHTYRNPNRTFYLGDAVMAGNSRSFIKFEIKSLTGNAPAPEEMTR